ncbi:MAG: CHAP domain-containing protein [Salinibacterium sp.]|nr:CHAP domain-containing protein [Salinibacterium sp.]
MAVVGGLFAVAALPAYATVDASAPSTGPAGKPQSFEVSADAAAAVGPPRDTFRATSPEQLAELVRQQTYLASGAQAQGDDYPWPYEATDDEGGPLSPLNYYYRECVDFVAWRLNRDAGYPTAPFKWKWADLTPTGGDGSQWLSAWQSNGWPVSDTPIVGSVAYTGGNHVAYVKQVLDGGYVVLEEYNFVPHVYSQRTVATSSVVAFLYPPPA